jgi:hypothetical protein
MINRTFFSSLRPTGMPQDAAMRPSAGWRAACANVHNNDHNANWMRRREAP